MCTEQAKGMTLIELVLAIAIAGVLVVALMTSYSAIVGRSSDPLVRTQSIALAESFLEEVTSKPFAATLPCPAPPSGNRDNYTNLCDYAGYSASVITLPNGTAVSELSGYSVAIAVASIGSGELGSIPGSGAFKITVSISNPLNETISLVGYRTDYESTSP